MNASTKMSDKIACGASWLRLQEGIQAENNISLLINYVHNSYCMFHVNTYASVTKVSIIKEDFMMMMVDIPTCPRHLAPAGPNLKISMIMCFSSVICITCYISNNSQ